MAKILKRIPRNPGKFEPIDLFDDFLRRQGMKLTESTTEQSFINNLTYSLNQSKVNPIIIHGRRTELMFGYVAASLGKCKAIKREDKGEVFAVETEMQPPDYRVVLDNGDEFLVEVKNHRPKDPKAPYRFRKKDLLKLLKYAEVFNRELKIAIYWSKWNFWTLITPHDIDMNKSKIQIELPVATSMNEMSLLGDQSIATVPPLIWRLKPDPLKPIEFSDTDIDFTIGAVELYCANTLIQDRAERNLVFYFMLFGRWLVKDPQPQIKNGTLESMDWVAIPETRTPGQQFEFVGDLSGMISRYYNFLTAPSGEIERLQPSHEPGTLGVHIPPTSKDLKLWRFTLRKSSPSHTPI